MPSDSKPADAAPVPDFATVSATFSAIYGRDAWGNGSGEGSSPEVTGGYRDFLRNALKTLGVRSVVDLGCGDWQFSRLMDWSGVDYTGIDVDPALVALNTERYGRDGLRFSAEDIFATAREADLLICKDVLQHWPNAMIAAFRRVLPRFRVALITNCAEPARYRNVPIELGHFRPLDLRAAPFGWPVDTVFSFGSNWWRKEVVLWDREHAVRLDGLLAR